MTQISPPRRLPLASSPSLGNKSSNSYATHSSGRRSYSNDGTKSPSARRDRADRARQQTLDALTANQQYGDIPDDLSRKLAKTPTNRTPTMPAASTRPSLQSPGLGRSQMATPGKMNGGGTGGDIEVAVGDTVDVPGGMTGLVKYLGSVEGKTGVFAGVELTRNFASKGKNDGDVDGVRYFATSVPGSGIFLPAHRAVKQESPALSSSTFPPTPQTPSSSNLQPSQRPGDAQTPPTPLPPKYGRSIGSASRPNFSQSVGSGLRAPSPQSKPKTRPSLPRPESPLRRQTPSLQPTPSTSRTSSGFGASVRGGRPSATTSTAGRAVSNSQRTPGAVRPPSQSQSRTQQYSLVAEDSDSTPTASHITKITNGISSAAQSRMRQSSVGQSAQELQRVNEMLGERDKQLKGQAIQLAEMENSLAELQSLMAQSSELNGSRLLSSRGENGPDEADASQLRILLREKNDKISMLTAEFDSHRADFRSTIDTLEMASTETERVYEKRVEELMQEIGELRTSGQDVDVVAKQLRQLGDFVQELEEGLEDARRGEAEASGEVEFLRGEVERGRSELRREREKAAAALQGAGAAVGYGPTTPGGSQALEQRDDEIRGLKAIIHSLSAGAEVGTPMMERANVLGEPGQEDVTRLKEAMDQLQREKTELQGLVDRKTYREEELEREVSSMREVTVGQRDQMDIRDSVISYGRQSVKTVVTADGQPFSQRSSRVLSDSQPQGSLHRRQNTAVLSPTEESRTESSVTSESLWCEICETSGHDILTCENIAGNNDSKRPTARTEHTDDANEATLTPESLSNQRQPSPLSHGRTSLDFPKPPTNGQGQRTGKDVVATAFSRTLSPTSPSFMPSRPLRTSSRNNNDEAVSPKPPPKAALPLPPEGDGPAAGKSSGVIDMAKWCAMCERDGHESVDCPFEEEY